MGYRVTIICQDRNAENISAVEVAEICETISYEIVCGVSQRVPRKYINRK